MAPEQGAADPSTDHRADLYAFGVMAYEMLSGQPPFAGRAPAALIAAHASEPPEPLDRRRPGLPPALSALVMRCLEKRPRSGPRGRC
jgi:serine/threonine-protein kinase